MAKTRITLGLPYHPRTRALIDGEIAIDGYELEITHDPSAGERHYRFAQGEWDIGEYSAATFLRTREKGFRFFALPIFFERGPRQRNIYHCEGKLNHPSELKGKKIGCFRYGATAVVWARGFLLDEYGLKTTDMNWYVSWRDVYIGRELPVKVERLDPPPPFGHEKPHLAKLLSQGDIHAALVAGDSGYPGLFGGGVLPKAMGEFPGVKPLFDDAEEIIRWVREKRIYPIIHLIAMKEEAIEISGPVGKTSRSLSRSQEAGDEVPNGGANRKARTGESSHRGRSLRLRDGRNGKTNDPGFGPLSSRTRPH